MKRNKNITSLKNWNTDEPFNYEEQDFDLT